MSRYWSEFPHYGQPDTAELKRKSAASQKAARARGKTLEPVIIQEGRLPIPGGERRGVTTWSAMPITRAGSAAENVMSATDR